MLGRFYDGIEYRGTRQEVVETLAAHAGVPVWNGLTDDWHPTQSLCDALTMREHTGKPDDQIAYAYVGDARFNIGNSLLVTGAMLGSDVRIVAPRALLARRRGRRRREEVCRRDRRARHAHRRRRPRACGAWTSCTPMSGCRWASPRRSGPSASSC